MLIAHSLLLIYLLGLGLSLALPVPELLADLPRRRRREKAALLAALLAGGILLDYLLLLLFGNLRATFVAGGILAVAGIGNCAWKLRGSLLHLFRIGWFRWALMLYLVAVYVSPLLLDPLHAGDARSIWFFHGKMIYYTGGLTAETGLAEKAVTFSHVDYPKLVGLLAAQFATVAGYWNEFLPKGSLLVLFLPLVFGIVSFAGKMRMSSLYLVALFFFGSGWHLWNGHMDAFMALYGGLSVLFFGRWLREGTGGDFGAGLLLLGVAMNLKNEGVLLALCEMVALGAVLLLTRKQKVRPASWRVGAVLALPLLCVALWSVKKSAWGLENDLRLGLGSLPLIRKHLAEGALRLIGSSLIQGALVGKGALLAVAAVVAAKAFRLRIPVSVWLAFLTASLYFAGMFTIYLATTADLQWHLSTSANRTMMTVLSCLFAGTFLLLREIEDTRSDTGYNHGITMNSCRQGTDL